MTTKILLALVAVLLAAPYTVLADTLIIVGVAVDKSGQRIPGALVRLYATSQALKEPLAEDRTSERGIFSLNKTNIVGDIGTLFVVYEGEGDKTALPLKVTLKKVGEALIQSRTSDLVVLPIVQNASLSTAEAAERIAAITQTQAVLVDAGVSDQAKSGAIVASRTNEIMARVTMRDSLILRKQFFEGTPAQFALPDIDAIIMGNLGATAAAAVAKTKGSM